MPFPGASFVIPALGTLFGGMASGRGQGRVEANQQALNRDALGVQQQNALRNALITALSEEGRADLGRAILDLDRRRFALDAPGLRAGNAVRGDLLATARTPSTSHPRANIPNRDFGFGPDDFSAGTRELGALQSQRALEGERAGDTFADVPTPDFRSGLLPPVPLTQPAEPSGFDRFLSVAAPIAQVGGAILGGVQEERDRQEVRDFIDRILGQPQQTTAGQQAQQIPALPPAVFNPRLRTIFEQ